MCHLEWLFSVVVPISDGILGKKGSFPFCTVSCSLHGHKASKLHDLGDQVPLLSLEWIQRMELLASSRLTNFARGKTCAW